MHIKSKESYLRKMQILLSFFFDEDDVTSIIYDYDEQFALIQDCDGIDKTQRHSIQSPWKECRKILTEAEISPVKALIAQKKFQLLLMLLLFICGSCYIMTRCIKSGADFLLCALGINVIVYIAMWLIDTNGIAEKQKFPRINISLFVYACIECLMTGLYMPNMVLYDVGKLFARLILTVTVCLIFFIAMIIAGSERMQGYSLLIHHVATILLNTLYFVSQMHILQNSISTFSFHIIIGAICLYCESIILYLFRIGANRFIQNYGRTTKTRHS